MNKFGKCITFDLTFTLIKVNGSVGIQYARIFKKSVKNLQSYFKTQAYFKNEKNYKI